MKRKLLMFIAIFIALISLLGYFYFYLPPVDHVASDLYDFSNQAQIYLEYIGTNLKNRNGIFPNHFKTRTFILNELKNAGYTDDEISITKIDDFLGKNIVLKIKGKDDSKRIVAGAHYDGDGVGDNGSGIALLLSNACGLYGKELPVTTYFVFFDEEETTGMGSIYFCENLTKKEIDSTIYMINIDSIAFGDYCNIYGGHQDMTTKEITKTEGYIYACDIAKSLGFNVYDTQYLDGYFARYGKGPDFDSEGIFTNPWTINNPAPENTVEEDLHYYSPCTGPFSDHEAFDKSGIPYIYFEATNWFAKTPYDDIAYTGYSDVGDESIGDKGLIMNTLYDTLNYLEENFPGRSLEHFKLYSPILTNLILNPM